MGTWACLQEGWGQAAAQPAHPHCGHTFAGKGEGKCCASYSWTHVKRWGERWYLLSMAFSRPSRLRPPLMERKVPMDTAGLSRQPLFIAELYLFIYFAGHAFLCVFIYLIIHLLEIKTFCKNKKEEKRTEVVIMLIADRQRQGPWRQSGISLPPAARPTNASCPGQ